MTRGDQHHYTILYEFIYITSFGFILISAVDWVDLPKNLAKRSAKQLQSVVFNACVMIKLKIWWTYLREKEVTTKIPASAESQLQYQWRYQSSSGSLPTAHAGCNIGSDLFTVLHPLLVRAASLLLFLKYCYISKVCAPYICAPRCKERWMCPHPHVLSWLQDNWTVTASRVQD